MVNVTETNRKPVIRVAEIEDGSGVSHTGELADISDLPGFTSPVSYSPGHTSWSDGLSNEEVYRFDVPSGSSFTIESLQFLSKGGGSTNSNASISTTVGGTTITADLNESVFTTATESGTATITVTLSNSTGGSINASPMLFGRIE